jgi:hypothetical protein
VKRVPLGAEVAEAARGVGRVDGTARGADGVVGPMHGAGRVDRATCGASRRASGGVEIPCGRHMAVEAEREGSEAT